MILSTAVSKRLTNTLATERMAEGSLRALLFQRKDKRGINVNPQSKQFLDHGETGLRGRDFYHQVRTVYLLMQTPAFLNRLPGVIGVMRVNLKAHVPVGMSTSAAR